MNRGIWGWDEVDLPLISQWRKIHVNAVGDVQVDVGSSALPLGGASAANQVITNASLTALEAAQGQCYGWDGAAWQKLLTEDDTDFNLRVKLYDGADDILAFAWSLTSPALAGKKLLAVAAGLYVHRDSGYFDAVRRVRDLSDNDAGTYMLPVCNWGFDGTSWDRLRSYGTGILKVARAEAGLSNSGVLSGVTAVKASAGSVYWMSVSDTAALSIELNDSTDGTGTDIWAAALPANCYGHYIFDPPLEFATGIYLDVDTATCKIVVGYL